MVITREVDYALRILRALSKESNITTKVICEKECVPLQFAYKIIKKLQKSNIVSIKRGAVGGCSIAKDLDKITLYDLMKAVDSVENINVCMNEGYKCKWREKNNKTCSIHLSLKSIQTNVYNELKKYSISEIIE